MCWQCQVPGSVRPDDGNHESREPIPANRFEKVQRRAKAAGMVVGIYLTKAELVQPEPHHALCDADVCYSDCRADALPALAFRLKGGLDDRLDQQLDIVEDELTYWEGR